jgi:hypothetical protein
MARTKYLRSAAFGIISTGDDGHATWLYGALVNICWKNIVVCVANIIDLPNEKYSRALHISVERGKGSPHTLPLKMKSRSN